VRGCWRCRIILRMICTRTTPPSRPMLQRSLSLSLSLDLFLPPPHYFLSFALSCRKTTNATSLQHVCSLHNIRTVSAGNPWSIAYDGNPRRESLILQHLRTRTHAAQNIAAILLILLQYCRNITAMFCALWEVASRKIVFSFGKNIN